MPDDPLPWISAAELTTLYARRDISPVEVVDAMLKRASRLQPLLNPFVLLNGDTALATAKACELRWREGKPLSCLDGVPTTIKDTIFSRAPLFFTLFLILDSRKNKVSVAKLESALPKIDAIFNSEIPVDNRKKTDAAFYVALASNPHRIKSRKVRDTYVRGFLA